ncbi:MAG TPA: hypothetical protein VFU50_18025 [Terriglobales bacterium]|nr:hypothetical protein [Terriglobales bacterium]
MFSTTCNLLLCPNLRIVPVRKTSFDPPKPESRLTVLIGAFISQVATVCNHAGEIFWIACARIHAHQLSGHCKRHPLGTR